MSVLDDREPPLLDWGLIDRVLSEAAVRSVIGAELYLDERDDTDVGAPERRADRLDPELGLVLAESRY